MIITKSVLMAGVLGLTVTVACAAPIYVGSGDWKGNVLLNFGDDAVYHFVVAFETEPTTGLGLLDTLESAGIGFSTVRLFDGLYIGTISYDGHSDADSWSIATPEAYWRYWVKDGPGTAWTYSNVGAADRDVYDKYWDGWVYGRSTTPVPEPMTVGLVAISAAGLVAVRRRRGRG
jgi:hypothetical protein